MNKKQLIILTQNLDLLDLSIKLMEIQVYVPNHLKPPFNYYGLPIIPADIPFILEGLKTQYN
jgi:hypothetical protein